MHKSSVSSSARFFARLRRTLVLGCLVCALPLFAPRIARGDSAHDLAKVTELRDVAIHARGALVYAALRKLWRQWDQGDPAQVEEALGEIANGTEATPPARAYAGLLVAYSRRRRGDSSRIPCTACPRRPPRGRPRPIR